MDDIIQQCPFYYKIPKDRLHNLYWRIGMYKKVIDDPYFCEVLWRACQMDPIFFINGFVWTYDPRGTPCNKIPFILYEYQENAFIQILQSINRHDILIEKSRDMGASWLCVMSFLWQWLFMKRRSFLMVSRVEDYVDKTGNPKALFWKFDFALENLPHFLKPIGYKSSIHRSKMHIENPENGSVVDGESTTGKVARGDRRTAIMLDEFASVEQGFSVLSSTRDATPCRIFNSTPEGTGNAFYYIRETGIKRLRLHWTLHPEKSKGLYETSEDGGLHIIDKDGYGINHVPILDGKTRSPWYDEQCSRTASEHEIAQELEISFLGSGYQFFNCGKIDESIRKYARDPYIIGTLEYDSTSGEPVRFIENPKGKIKLWCLLDKDNSPTLDDRLVFGIDVSSGTGTSNSVCAGYSIRTNEKVVECADPFVRPELFAAAVVALARWFAKKKPYKPLIIWEANGPGRQFGSRVTELDYWNIYYKRHDESLKKKVTLVPGFYTTRESKLVLIGDYRNAVESGNCVNRSKIALEETLEYVFAQNGSIVHTKSISKIDPSGASSNHGDRVIADALAWKCINEKRTVPEVNNKPDIPIGCLAWRMELREKQKKRRNRELGREWR